MIVLDSETGLSVRWSWAEDRPGEAQLRAGPVPGPDAKGPTTPPASAQGKKSHVLTVDDEPAICELLSLLFEHEGLQVTTAHSLAEGLARIEDTEYQVAVFDWTLHGEPSGLRLLERSRARRPDAPVIIFTGFEESQELEHELAGRAAAVMRKMGSLQALSAEVKRRLKR